MLKSLEVENYRSLRRFRMECGPLTLVTGANGTGKSNVYRALALLKRWAAGELGRAVAEEGGMDSVLWRGPLSGGGLPGSRLRIRACMEPLSCELIAGLRPEPKESRFRLVPEIKEERIWQGNAGPKPSKILASRAGRGATVVDAAGQRRQERLPDRPGESLLSLLRDARNLPVLAAMREQLAGWKFYHQFRADAASPLRQPAPGAWVPSLADNGDDLASAVASILESEQSDAFCEAIATAFPGSRPDIETSGSRFFLQMESESLGRAFDVGEWSDGTLRYVALAAALLAPASPPLIVLNEPEASLHPALLPGLAGLIAAASERSQVWVITHSDALAGRLASLTGTTPVNLRMEDGETTIHGRRVHYVSDETEDGEAGFF